jgi:hypothetical protein
MEKRYQVFLSSTYQDLSIERLEVIKALLELDCIPCGMEYFPAASEDSWSYITSLIDQCDYYIAVVGGRYGSTTEEGVSFTEKEYRYALSKGIPTIAFIHSSPQDLPFKKTEQSQEGRKKLEEFIGLVRKNLCKDWSTAHELGAVVSRSLTQLVKRHPRVGWIPASHASDPRATQELLEMTKKVAELERELIKARGKEAPNISELADGDEVVDLETIYSVRALEKGKESLPRDEVVARYETTASVTWNDLFRIVAPRITPTASDLSIRKAIGRLLQSRLKPLPRSVGAHQRISTVTVSDDHYNVIKVQFMALGVVTIATERPENSYTDVLLWRLTEKGEARLTNALAIRKNRANQALDPTAAAGGL